MRPGSRGDEHVQGGCQQDGSTKHPAESRVWDYCPSLPPKQTLLLHPEAAAVFQIPLRGFASSK